MALSDLSTKGYCVIRNLFNTDQLDAFGKDFDLIKSFPVDRSYPVLPVGKEIDLTEIIDSVVSPLSSSISTQANVNTDFHPTPVYFSIGHGVNFGWHQDHESFFSTANHLDYLNIYFPIHKPIYELSNICVVDFEKLINLDPSLEFLKGYGATRFDCQGDKTIIYDDNTDSVIEVKFNLNDIADCPYLNEGDALIMRGDCIHRTQDALSSRVAVSIRRMNTNTVVQRSNFDFTSKAKEHIFKGNIEIYNKRLSTFNGRDSVTVGELYNVRPK